MDDLKKNRPDNIVYNDDSGEFDASKKPYPTTIGSANFKPISIDKETSYKAEQYFTSRFNEIKSEYEKLLEEFNDTSLVYEAECNYVPIPGNSYYLYKRENGGFFLSMIEPSEWKQEYVGTFVLQNNGTWIKTKK